MFLQLLGAVTICFLSWLYLRWMKVRAFWADRKVPHLRPSPLFGSLTFLRKQNAGLWMRDMYSRFQSSPYFGIWLFWRPALVINSPEIGKNILIKDSDNFRNRFLSSGKTDPIGSLNLFTVNDPVWSMIRKQLTSSFTSAKLRALNGLFLTKSSQVVERIRKDNKSGKIIDLRTMYADYTTDVIGIAAFGVSSEATLTGEGHMRNVTKEFMKYSVYRGIAWTTIFFFPALVDFLRMSLFPKATTEYFSKVFHAITLQRQNDGLEHKDLLDALLKIKREAADNNKEITDEMLIAQGAIFLQGGFDTSAVSLTFVTYEMAHNQQAQGMWMRDMYSQYKDSPYFGMWLFWRPALVINSPEIAKKILVEDFDNFRNRFARSGKHDPMGYLNLFGLKEPLWTPLRKRLTPTFTAAKIRVLHNLTSRKCRELVQRIHDENEERNPTELRSLFTDLTTDIIGTAAFGVKSEATTKGESQLRKITGSFKKYSFFRGIIWMWSFFFPEMVDLSRCSVFSNESTKYFRKIFYAVASQRELHGIEHKDLLDALMKIKREKIERNEEVNDDLLLAQAIIFLQAGFDTTAVNLTYVIYEMAFNPEAQKKIYECILEAKKEFGDEVFNPDVLSKIKYIDCIIEEALRLWPAMGFLDRVADKDYKIDENLTITAGTPVYVNAIGIQYDSNYYSDPMEFKPDRFLAENKDNVKQFTYMPFGQGPRSCIGTKFAYMIMRHAIAAIFHDFEVRPLDNATKPRDCEAEKNSIFMMPGVDMRVQFVPRNAVKG